MTTEPMAYIWRAECGHVRISFFDRPDTREEAARAAAAWMREGGTIERVTVKEARNLIKKKCDCKGKP